MEELKEGANDIWEKLNSLDQKLTKLAETLEKKTEELLDQTAQVAEENLENEADLEKIIPEIPQMQDVSVRQKESLWRIIWNG